MLRAEVMEVFLCIRSPHPDPGVWALKSHVCGEADQELGYQFSYRNLTYFKKENSQQVSDTKES